MEENKHYCWNKKCDEEIPERYKHAYDFAPLVRYIIHNLIPRTLGRSFPHPDLNISYDQDLHRLVIRKIPLVLTMENPALNKHEEN